MLLSVSVSYQSESSMTNSVLPRPPEPTTCVTNTPEGFLQLQALNIRS